MNDQRNIFRRIEPIFGMRTPLLFAHRGGTYEAPESTVKAFNHAIHNAKAEILEIDLQLTKDGEIVVWHGPEVDNVRIEGQSNRPSERERRKIYHYEWKELDGKAWVADPDVKEVDEDEIDLSTVPQEKERCLLRFSAFLSEFKDIPLNIELKKSFKRRINDTTRKGLKDNLRVFTNILESEGERKVLVVSASDNRIDEFREISGDKYMTGLSIKEQMFFWFYNLNMKNRALETSHDENLSSKSIVRRVREAGGSTFVFLTGFGWLWPSIDRDLKQEKIFEVLDRGVDGVMTDRPQQVRQFIDDWISQIDGK